MRDASLPSGLITVLMGIIQRSSCRLLWNGECIDKIKSSRGLR